MNFSKYLIFLCTGMIICGATLMEKPKNAAVSLGSWFTLLCASDLTHSSNFTWYKVLPSGETVNLYGCTSDGIPPAPYAFVPRERGCDLLVFNAKAGDEGIFRCTTAKSEEGSASAAVALFDGTPTFTPPSIVAKIGTNVTYQCAVKFSSDIIPKVYATPPNTFTVYFENITILPNEIILVYTVSDDAILSHGISCSAFLDTTETNIADLDKDRAGYQKFGRMSLTYDIDGYFPSGSMSRFSSGVLHKFSILIGFMILLSAV